MGREGGAPNLIQYRQVTLVAEVHRTLLKMLKKISSLPFLLSCWCTVRFCTGEDAEGESNDLCQVRQALGDFKI